MGGSIGMGGSTGMKWNGRDYWNGRKYRNEMGVLEWKGEIGTRRVRR